MVSSGSVSNDFNSVNTSLSNYRSSFSSLSSSWQGASFDNLNAKVEEFYNEFKSVIETQMNAFASACSAYENYIQAKRSLESAQSAYNSAKASNNQSSMSAASSQITNYTNTMTRLKQEIETYLAQASSPTLSASSIDGNDPTVVQLSAGSKGAVVDSVISTAMSIAEDNSHGYSQKRRWGNPDYDCSSFVITCWDSAGTGVKAAGAGYTGNMRKAFLKTGLFEWIPGNPSVDSLQPGDVLLNENSHTEMYIGDGKMIGAHGDRDGYGGDSSGKEINVVNYHGGWQGVLRYIGDQNVAVSI